MDFDALSRVQSLKLFSKSFRRLLPAVLLGLATASPAGAVRPLSATIAMVAGDEGRHGYLDGSFTSALFNRPLGMAINPEGTLLYVADSRNQRIRVIHLDQDNEVTTLCGQEGPGFADGSLAQARFHDPRGILCLPDGRLVVNDFGNQLLRLLDLKAGTVTTLAGGAVSDDPKAPPSRGATLSVGPAARVSLKGVLAMAYLPEADSIALSQPESGSLKLLSLKTGLVSAALDNDAKIPHPAALFARDKRLFVADKDAPQIFAMEGNGKGLSAPAPFRTTGAKVISLISNGNILYAFLDAPGIPSQRFVLDPKFEKIEGDPDKKLVSFLSPGGDTVLPEALFPPREMTLVPWMGVAPDPNDGRKFYVAETEFNMVASFRDLFQTGFYNSNGLIAPEYPAKKPPKTFRIVIVGDSRSMEIHDYPYKTDFHSQTRPPESPYYPSNYRLGPQVERELNFRAALDGVPWNFEVFNSGRHGELLFWPTYDMPDLVKRNDIDLVVILSPQNDYGPMYYYFDHPLTPDGIPQYPNDMEYYLKPPLERIPDGCPGNFMIFARPTIWWNKREGISGSARRL